MKQFRHIFSFGYKSYVCNKVFVVLTVILILLMAVVLFFPRFSAGKSRSPAALRHRPTAFARYSLL